MATFSIPPVHWGHLALTAAFSVALTACDSGPRVKDMATSGNHALILLSNGTLLAMGSNVDGQLGNGTITDRREPHEVMTDVQAVSVSNDHSMILKTDGTLWAAGNNYFGQLGDGTTSNRSMPVQVMTDVAAVSAGGYHTMILKTDGTLWASGFNLVGERGIYTTPKQVMSDVQAVSAGPHAGGDISSRHHTMILKRDGTLWAVGDNMYGQLGDGTIQGYGPGDEPGAPRVAPVQVMTAVRAVSAGYWHTMILKSDGTLWAAGNSFGHYGEAMFLATPVQVMTGVAAVSAGGSHTMILKTDGTLWSAGSNYAGQLGDGTTTHRSTPVQVMSDVQAVAAGGDRTMILKRDGTLCATLWNHLGVLQTGTWGRVVLPLPKASRSGTCQSRIHPSEESRPAQPATQSPPTDEVNPPPTQGFQVLAAPVYIPSVIPEIDLSKALTNEDDWSGRSVADGVASGVVGGTGPVNPEKSYFFDFEVEKPVGAMPGSAGPRYPVILRSSGVEGQVLVQFVVDTTGRIEVSTFQVLRSDHADFEQAVRSALPNMRFFPAEIGGRKVRQLVQQPFVFALQR